jgi:16S rRNA (cytosine1402-N4)-methyltransferase
MQKIRGKIFAFDKDISAIERAISTFEEEFKKPSPRIVLFNKSFSKARAICEVRGNAPNGILLDLGVSSKQLDSAQRGISYRINSPLDMRFDSESNISRGSDQITAKDILNSRTEDELTAMFRNYGEEPKSGAIARRIIEARRAKTLETTYDLRAIIEDCTPKVHHFKTLSRIFQAIRIEVNQELEELTTTLKDIIDILKPNGRIVVISYHSLEDRIVKQIFKENSFTVKTNKYAGDKIDKELTNYLSNTMPKLKLITAKPIIPSENEIKRNPRARSAKMRVAEKL